jgi:hypothetical protein
MWGYFTGNFVHNIAHIKHHATKRSILFVDTNYQVNIAPDNASAHDSAK